ncbi:glycine-rich domain-containing protein [Foetidibacter luteolus]|uniref:glycine-rich domain-containing protein n=1 Tax=Foetidibacter luteolus TaxID=2608880 RepID=UPI001A984912|nr:hypothetical protein [Foetidibacter luteolus]
MKTNEQTLWAKIHNFALDAPGASFTFTDRLARQNGWTKTYTQRAIEEYKKFIFLCCITPTGVTPSDPVDQAWHLHLTYTKSYWVDLCRNTLEKEIHHNPTKGGKAEAQKFDGYYTGVHTLYKETFGYPPPADIWHNNKERFSNINFQRVNLSRYWLIKKPVITLRDVMLPAALALIVMLFIQAAGAEVLVVAVAIIIVALIIKFAVEPFVEKERKNRSDGGSCSAHTYSSCSGGDGCHSHGDGHSGCSGCSSSGCSGCGGGGD